MGNNLQFKMGFYGCILPYLFCDFVALVWLKAIQAVASVAAVSVAGLIYPDYPLVPFTVGSMALVLFTSTQKGVLSDWFDT